MGYEDLRIAIVARAIRDYNSALGYGKERAIYRLEKFFLSSWGQFLTNYHGEHIIQRCKKEIKPIAKGEIE